MEKLLRERDSVIGHRRRQALTSEDILQYLPNDALANHLSGIRAKPTQPPKKKSNEAQAAKVSSRNRHVRRNAMDWTSFSSIMYSTPSSFHPGKTRKFKLDPSSIQHFSHDVKQTVEQPLPSIYELPVQLPCTCSKSKCGREISSLDYSESSSFDESEDSVQEGIESAMVASVALVLDFSSIEKKLGDFKCAICLDHPNTLDCLATVSGCDHCFCFSCIDSWAVKKNECPLCKKEFHLVASRRRVRWY